MPITRPIRRVGALLGLCALAACAGGASAGERKSPGGEATPASLYHNYCSVCHGDRGDGRSRAQNSLNPPPRDFTTPEALLELSRSRMILAVKEGRPGTAMVGWKTQLSDRQVEAVVDHVRETFMRATASADASRGRQIYAKTCSVCHGDRGAGSMWASANLNPPPRDFSLPAAKADLSREQMIVSVTHGRPETAMAAFGSQLSREDIAAVVDYVRGAFMDAGPDAGISGTRAHVGGAAKPNAAPRAGESAAGADMKLPLPYSLAGNMAKGKAFYEGNCATCHGKTGDGKGPRAYFINPKPRNFLTAESRRELNRPTIFAFVSGGKRGTEMPAWDKVLTRKEIADVSEYVFRSFIGPDAGAKTAQATR